MSTTTTRARRARVGAASRPLAGDVISERASKDGIRKAARNLLVAQQGNAQGLGRLEAEVLDALRSVGAIKTTQFDSYETVLARPAEESGG
ncbi:MAG: hypothetical protein WKG00_01810 [Polyangiaceae bacterium]